MSILDGWQYALIAAMEEHEETHAAGDHSCMAETLEKVPNEVRMAAQAYMLGFGERKELRFKVVVRDRIGQAISVSSLLMLGEGNTVELPPNLTYATVTVEVVEI